MRVGSDLQFRGAACGAGGNDCWGCRGGDGAGEGGGGCEGEGDCEEEGRGESVKVGKFFVARKRRFLVKFREI